MRIIRLRLAAFAWGLLCYLAPIWMLNNRRWEWWWAYCWGNALHVEEMLIEARS